MSKLTSSCLLRGALLMFAAMVGLASASAQTFSSLHLFHGYDGVAPRGSVLLASDDMIYGTTAIGGNFNGGTIFRVNLDGSGFAVLYHFPDNGTGMRPQSGLTEGADGLLYGTTQVGLPNFGSVYRIAKDGSGFTVLQNFTTLASGGNSSAPLIQAADGLLYGTARNGGTFSGGTVFRLNPNGTGFAVVHHLNAATEGGQVAAGLLQGNDGALYGVATAGGQFGNGTVFRLNPDGTGFAVLHHFNKAAGEGEIPLGTLIQAGDGLLYGTTFHGGQFNRGTAFRLAPDGSGFATIHHFRGGSVDGAEPVNGGLVQNGDDLLYGLTQIGGIRNFGTLFKMATDGSSYAVAVDFIGGNGKDGGGTLAADGSGDLYGAAAGGGEVTSGLLNSGLVFCFGAPKVPRITSANNLSTNFGQALSYQITATGSPTAFDATGLPAGVSVNTATGLISGTIGAAGNFPVVLSATNSVGTGTGPLSLNVSPAQATVTLGQLNFAYDGTPKPVTVTTSPAGISVSLSYNGAPTIPANAGSYAVVATIDDPNYSGSASGTLVITPGAATVTLGSLTQGYDGSPKAATVTTSPAGLSVSFTYDGTASLPTNAGSYAVTATITDPNYTGSGSGTLVVAKAAASVAFTNLAQTYDGAPKPVPVTTTPSGLAFSLTYNGGAGVPVNAGSYAVAATVNDANYTGSGSGTLVVGKAAAGIVLGGLNSTYDGSVKPVTVTTTPAGLTVNLTYDGGATPPTSAGNYAILASVVDGNYGGSASGTLNIVPAAQTITFPAIPAHTFGDAAFPLSASASSGLPVSYSVVAGPATVSGNAVTLTGAGNVTLRASQAGNGNYLAAPDVDVVFAVAKAPASLSLGGLEQIFDTAPKSATATTGPAGLNVIFTYDGATSPPVNAGSYAVTATIADANYTGSANGTLVISPAVVTITLGNLLQTYDASPKPVTATTSPAGLVVSFTYNGTASLPVNAGSYAVAAAINNPNYTGSSSGTLVVAKASGSVTLGNLAQAYDGSPKPVSATTAPTGLAISVTYNGSASVPVNAGSYAVAATINDANYSGSTSGTLVVGQTAASVSLGGLNQTYNGSPRSATATTTPAGLAVSVTYNGSATPPTNAGSYAVAATVADGNHTGSASGTLVIGKATASLALGNLSQTYNGAPKPVTVTTAPAGLGVGVTYAGSVTVPTNAGTYAISATIADPNYTGSATGTLTVAKATAAVTLSNLAQVYNGTARPVTVITAPAGLATSVTYNGSATVPTNAGSYAVVATVNNANYTGTASGTLKVSLVLQASSLARASSGPATSVTNDAAAPGGTWVKLASTASNQWVQFTTASIPAGTYQLQFIYRSNPTRAKHSVKVDGTTIGATIDQYASTAAYQALTVGSITFSSAGTHTIRLTTTARNSASSGFDLAAVQFILNPP